MTTSWFNHLRFEKYCYICIKFWLSCCEEANIFHFCWILSIKNKESLRLKFNAKRYLLIKYLIHQDTHVSHTKCFNNVIKKYCFFVYLLYILKLNTLLEVMNAFMNSSHVKFHVILICLKKQIWIMFLEKKMKHFCKKYYMMWVFLQKLSFKIITTFKRQW